MIYNIFTMITNFNVVIANKRQKNNLTKTHLKTDAIPTKPSLYRLIYCRNLYK